MPAFDQSDYNTGLCQCFDDVSSCMEGCFCPYCMISQEYNMLTRKERSINYMMCLGMITCDVCLTFGIALAAGSVITRDTMRSTHNMYNTSGMLECLKGFLCVQLSASQMYREMSIRHQWPGGICVSTPYRHPSIQAPQVQSMQGGSNAMPAQGAPVYGYPVVQNPPQPGGGYGYGQATGYGYPQPASNAPGGYPGGYGAPAPGYGAPVAVGYGAAPAPGYGVPPQPSYGAPPSGNQQGPSVY